MSLNKDGQLLFSDDAQHLATLKEKALRRGSR